MEDKFTLYFETTSRIDENCGAIVELKNRLQGSNNLAWLALAEVQNVYEAIQGLEAKERVEVAQKAITKLEEVTEQHQQLLGMCIHNLEEVSKAIANDLDLMEKMAKEKEALSFQSDFEAAGKAVVNEFRKPSTELDEAEELQGLMAQYRLELKSVA